MSFTWIPIYKEIAAAVLKHRNDQGTLIRVLEEAASEGLPMITLGDRNSDGEDIPLDGIDPFTVFASFNRGVSEQNRKMIIQAIQRGLGLPEKVPDDFSGLPRVNNQAARFFVHGDGRKSGDIDALWDMAEEAFERSPDEMTADTVAACLGVRGVGEVNLSMGCFWFNPYEFLACDRPNTSYFKATYDITLKFEPLASYVALLSKVRELSSDSFPDLSRKAWEYTQAKSAPAKNWGDEDTPRYWLLSAGTAGSQWDSFRTSGTIAIDYQPFDENVRDYATKQELQKRIQETRGRDSSKKNDTLALWQFASEMKPGDYVFIKQGPRTILGVAKVVSDYRYEGHGSEYKHIRDVEYLETGEWECHHEKDFPTKTLTDVTTDSKLMAALLDATGMSELANERAGQPKQFWWITANPSVWDPSESSIGDRQTYTSHNENGHKRRIYTWFSKVNAGDMVILYVSSPKREIVGTCRVTSGLHTTPEGEIFEFEHTERVESPVPIKSIEELPEFTSSEPARNKFQGSLFRLSQRQYDVIRTAVEAQSPFIKGPGRRGVSGDAGELSLPKLQEEYSLDELSRDVGLPLDQITQWKQSLERKKQAIFYGPPGTGKTFIAERLARHLIGGGNGFRDLVQFHPAYSYEDFMQGIRPKTRSDGSLEYVLEPGRFLTFCKKAKLRDGTCVLIIDEINRANLSRVFGELMYLLEYRNNAVPLASGGELSIPDNVLIIGTMNTADRSIALVDHALRRRFAFCALYPDYDILTKYHKDTGTNVEGLIATLKKLNGQIDDRHYHIGISFFLEPDLAEHLEDIWRMEIEPYVEEFFFDRPEKADSFTWEKVKDAIGIGGNQEVE